jgi:hypothetical protein
VYSTVHELFAFHPHASYRCLLCACVYVCVLRCALCVLLLFTWTRSSWGYVAAMATDKAMLRELMEQDENFINPLYIHLAQRLLHGLLYVSHSCPLPPSSIDRVCAEVQESVIVIVTFGALAVAVVEIVCRKEKEGIEAYCRGKPAFVGHLGRVARSSIFEKFIIFVVSQRERKG